MNRTVAVARTELASWPRSVGLAWVILLLVFGGLLAAYAITGVEPTVRASTAGGLSSIFFVQLVVAYQSVTQYFPFLAGLGVTRRTFWSGTCALFVLEAVGYGLVLAALSRVEVATGGWGRSAFLFSPFVLGGAAGRWGVYAAGFLLAAALGLLAGAVVKRFGVVPLLVGSVALAVVAAVVVAAVGTAVGWTRVGSTAADLPTAVSAGLAPVLAAVVVGLQGWLTLRPRHPLRPPAARFDTGHRIEHLFDTVAGLSSGRCAWVLQPAGAVAHRRARAVRPARGP